MITIKHISDIVKIPEENFEEFLSDLRGTYLSLILLKSTMPDGFDFSKSLLCINFNFDGKGEVTPMCNGQELFTMRVVRDSAPNPERSEDARDGRSAESRCSTAEILK